MNYGLVSRAVQITGFGDRVRFHFCVETFSQVRSDDFYRTRDQVDPIFP